AAGVEAASVNLMTNTAHVTFDSQATSPETLVETVRGTGYGAELPAEHQSAIEAQGAQDEARDREFKELRTKAVVTFAIGVVAMVAPMLAPMPVMSASSGAPAAWWIM